MSEIGPVVMKQWDHDAQEMGLGPNRMALRVTVVGYEIMNGFLGGLHPDATIMSITPVDAGAAQVVYRTPHEAPKAAAQADKPLALSWTTDGDDWRAESQGAKLVVFHSWDGHWQWMIDPGGPCEWSGSGDYATREIARGRAESVLPEWLENHRDDGFAAVEWRGGRGPHDATGAPLTVYQTQGLWFWYVDQKNAANIQGYARTEADARRRAFDAWREFEALRREVEADAGSH